MSPLGSYKNTTFLDPVSIKYPTTKKVNYIPEEDDDLNEEISNVKAKLDFLRESQVKSPTSVNTAPISPSASPQMGKEKTRKITPIEDIFKFSIIQVKVVIVIYEVF